MVKDTSKQYISAADITVSKDKAPGMHCRLLSEINGVKEYILVFAKGDEVLSGISDFVLQNNITSARFTAIGALKSATTAWFDLKKKSYKSNPVNQQVELVSLIGDIAMSDGKPVVHAHICLGFDDGRIQGGHLIEAICSPTVELFMTAFPVTLEKHKDKETDLKLIKPEAR